ncbi:hypothetical protein SAMN05421752_1168 [Natronorubrum thiooxidans]|uniref:Uncharacterized protein n=2 Tax=Natronorubrum thiooxidans TaxID=308853 RepID=A0A1N7GVD1_9EURY|nr:hypothetical protein SAMN05421752_1168 [Natronorubrum thiooxidans]
MTQTPDVPDDLDPEQVKQYVKSLPEEEREELLMEVQTEDVYPVVNWAPNPAAVKATFNFIADNGTVTYEELRQHLVDLDYADTDEGKYNFGIVSIEDDDPIFNTTGSREADTEISLTPIGENIASVFDESENIRPVERALLCGLQPYGSGFTYLSLLEEHREDGILRQDLEDAMVDQFGGKGKYFTGYFTSWYAKLGLLEKERVGRKKKFHPNFPEAW